MSIFKNCLLASDIDGTLVDNGYISPRNIEAIRYFKEQGGTFVLSTGRSPKALGQIFGLMDPALVGPCVVLNGGMLYDFSIGESLYSALIPDSAKEYTRSVLGQWPDVGIEIHSGDNICVLRRTEETDFHEDYELLDREYVTYTDVCRKPWNKVLYTCDTVEIRDKFLRWLEGNGSKDCDYVPTGLNAGGGHHPYVEQMPKGITKAGGLARLSEMLGIEKGGFFAIGDYYNDIEMLGSADVSSTPGDAPQDMQRLANFVGGSCRNGAVADFIEYLSKKRR